MAPTIISLLSSDDEAEIGPRRSKTARRPSRDVAAPPPPRASPQGEGTRWNRDARIEGNHRRAQHEHPPKRRRIDPAPDAQRDRALLATVFHSQVFPYIEAAIVKHRGRRETQELRTLGRRAAGAVVDVEFTDHVRQNKQLMPGFEKKTGDFILQFFEKELQTRRTIASARDSSSELEDKRIFEAGLTSRSSPTTSLDSKASEPPAARRVKVTQPQSQRIWSLPRPDQRPIPRALPCSESSDIRRGLNIALDRNLLSEAEKKLLVGRTVLIDQKRVRINKKTKATDLEAAVPALLRDRELSGLAPSRIRRGQRPFKAIVSSRLEDSLSRVQEWTDFCGDVTTIRWTGSDGFLCGATAHSDFHNQQYNKPGNLGFGSASKHSLQAVPDHRIERPVVGVLQNHDNALDAMRQTQDPWLYTSVVSSAYSSLTNYAFTASFDNTVKVWNADASYCGTWKHDGKVNFVVTSGEFVATACDVVNNAIRVYRIDDDDVTNSAYDTYQSEKASLDESRDSWAYFPATIAFGIAENVSHLLLAGFSPRSLTGNDSDIPVDKLHSGEICLWNCWENSRVLITSARTQNVFEVIWHPSQPIFFAATSPSGEFGLDTRTQVRLFAQSELGVFSHIRTLDCPGSDINELTIMPNSTIHGYVTASCTDGNTYVWDTARPDRLKHILSHGESLEQHDAPRERELVDEGVKFAAWGKTCDRLYTGSSDGKVKAWDIQAPFGKAFVRDVISLSGGISAGAFAEDFSKLLLGDTTAKVHLLTTDNSDDSDARTRADILSSRRRPKVLAPHPEPPPPQGYVFSVDETAREISQRFVAAHQILVHPDPLVGAVQGPAYPSTGLFRLEAHEGRDASQPLIPEYRDKQRSTSKPTSSHLPRLPTIQSSDIEAHIQNLLLELRLDGESAKALEREDVELEWDGLLRTSEEFRELPRLPRGRRTA